MLLEKREYNVKFSYRNVRRQETQDGRLAFRAHGVLFSLRYFRIDIYISNYSKVTIM